MQQQQPKPESVVFLEDWLRRSTTATNININSSSSVNATAILQAWSDLRDPSIHSHPTRLLSSLHTLSSHPPSSLHLADPHAKLLLSLLLTSSPQPDSLPLLSRLLYAWIRKSPRPSLPLLNSLLSALPRLLSPPSPSSLLLLAALSAAPALPDPSRTTCLDLLLLHHQQSTTADENLLPETLATLGYALSRSDDVRFPRILYCLFGIWHAGGGGGDGGLRLLSPSLHHGLMVLRLAEWLVSGFIHKRSANRIDVLCREISERRGPRFALVMVAAGVLRAFTLNSSSGRVELGAHLKSLAEGTIGSVAYYVVSGTEDGDEMERHLLLQCMSLGLVRCGLIAFNAPVFLCLCSALLEEVFPLRSLFRMAVENLNGDSSAAGLDKVKQHLGGILFKEAGAVTGVFCNQYAMADENHKAIAENCVWEYSQALYFDLRRVVFLLRGKNAELIHNLDKIAESAFLMVVVFAATFTRHKLNGKSSEQFRPEAAVKILVVFSCIEYLRRVRLPEYTEAVRRAVLTIQENVTACALFVESLPPYAELTDQRGSLALEGMRYAWWRDEVQTARMLFCLRVIPTCISLVPASVFGKLVAPTMFLYMRHPNEKVARASHSVFVAFVSSGKDSEQDDRLALKEQLVFYYMHRSLEAYPGVTPFEGLAAGVAALVRHLPAGSPAIFYCIHGLVEKANDLCSRALKEDATMWKSWEGNSEFCKKILDLLLRLIALVDIQVLPYLLKQLAEFVVQLPKQGQNVLLDEMYTQVAESDDVTRKPTLVSWLQSLSYLCSQKKMSVKKGGNAKLHDAAGLSASDGSSAMNGASGLALRMFSVL